MLHDSFVTTNAQSDTIPLILMEIWDLILNCVYAQNDCAYTKNPQ